MKDFWKYPVAKQSWKLVHQVRQTIKEISSTIYQKWFKNTSFKPCRKYAILG